MRSPALAALLLASTCTTADAQRAVDCAKATTTVELNACAEQELARADAALNEVYRKALAKISTTTTPKPYDAKSWAAALRASQRAWLAFRDADCKGLEPLGWGGGTATTGAVLGCMTGKTEARTADLKARFEIE